MFFSRALLVFASTALLIPGALSVPASPAAIVVDNRAKVDANAVINQAKAVLGNMIDADTALNNLVQKSTGNPVLLTLREQIYELFFGRMGILPNGKILSGGGLLGCLTGDSSTLSGLDPSSVLGDILANPTKLLNGNILGLGGLLGGLTGNPSLAKLLAALLGSLPGLGDGCTCDADILNFVGRLNNLVRSLNGLLALSGCGCGKSAQVVGILQPLCDDFFGQFHA